MSLGPDSVNLERKRDGQQWILDWVIKQSGREINYEYDERMLPPEVKSHAMIPRAMHKLAAHCESIARAAEAHGHVETARQLYFKAVEHYFTAQHAIFEDDNPNKIFLYERLTACFDRVIALNPYPIERVEIPWEGVTIAGVLHLLPDRRKAPTILWVPGMDMVKELIPDPGQNPFIARGMNVLCIDGPGQGISNLRKIRVTEDNYERAASAAVTYLTTRPEVDPEKIGACGGSMGSYWTARLAALDPRIKAVAAGAANYGGKRHIFETASPRFKQIFMYMAGIHDEEEFDKMAAKMHLKGYASRIRCPMLMTTGEYDPLTPLSETLAVFEELAGPKELWVLENDFHGVGRGPAGLKNFGGVWILPFLADWLRDALEGRKPKDLNRQILIPQSSGVGPYEEPIKDYTLRTRHPSTAL